MTKKRFRLSMAALGLLAAFFMVLIAVLLAPTLASANKDSGNHHGGASGYPHDGLSGAPHGSGNPGNDGNTSGHEQANAHDVPLCVDGGVYPCAILSDDDGAGGYSDNFENEYGGGGKPHGGDGSPNGGSHYSPTYWGGAPGGGGGAGGPNGGYGGGPGGGAGPGGGNGPDDGNGPGADNDGEKCGKHHDDETKSCDSIPGLKIQDLTPPDDDLPSPFVDPDFGDDNKPKAEDGPEGGPKGENPPVTELAVTEVPEPLTLSLFAVGLAGAAGLRRRTRKA